MLKIINIFHFICMLQLLVRARSSLYRMASSKYSSYNDPDGFDPYADTVGAGIYGGNVKRDENGNVIIGKQYKNHNPYPGPVYDGTGYTLMSKAVHTGDPKKVAVLLKKQPELVQEVSTGGATPLHTAGMSRRGQMVTDTLIEFGGDIEAVDSYGYRPLHRMASNDLAVGAEALLKAGAQWNALSGKPYAGETPMSTALQSGAHRVVKVLLKYEQMAKAKAQSAQQQQTEEDSEKEDQ